MNPQDTDPLYVEPDPPPPAPTLPQWRDTALVILAATILVVAFIVTR